MKLLFKLSLVILLIAGCAKIPAESVVLAKALQSEGERMHRLNIMLVNKIFSSKRDAIEVFIREKYEPRIIENFKKLLPANTDFKADFTELMQAITPEINARRDSLINALEIQKDNIIEKLNTDYKVFDDAADDLQNLLRSAVKIDKEKQAIFDKAKELSNNKIDFNKIENTLDKFINNAGNVSNGFLELNNDINNILKP